MHAFACVRARGCVFQVVLLMHMKITVVLVKLVFPHVSVSKWNKAQRLHFVVN
jgi:hypothetical protein